MMSVPQPCRRCEQGWHVAQGRRERKVDAARQSKVTTVGGAKQRAVREILSSNGKGEIARYLLVQLGTEE
jgi:hypothetical protein